MRIVRKTVSSLLCLGFLLSPAISLGKKKILYPNLPSGKALNKGIPLSDYAYNPNSREQYFQTWNFYFQADDGHQVFANFVISNLGIGDNACGLNISMNTPSGKSNIQTKQVSGDKFSSRSKNRNLHCGDSFMKMRANSIHIRGEYSDLGMDLQIKRKSPGLAIDRFYLDEDKKDYVHFNMPHVHSSARGRIKWNGRWFSVTGQAIVAHVNQNVGLHDYSMRWNRIRSLTNDTTLLIGGFDATDEFESGYTLLVLAKDDRILHATNQVEITPIRKTHHEKSEYRVPRDFKVEAKDKRLSLEGSVKTFKEIDEFEVLGHISWIIRVIAKAFFANPWVFRNGLEVDLKYQLDNSEPKEILATGVHEIIFVND